MDFFPHFVGSDVPLLHGAAVQPAADQPPGLQDHWLHAGASLHQVLVPGYLSTSDLMSTY
jgi:hypothetical protein